MPAGEEGQGLTDAPARRRTTCMVKVVFLCRRRSDLTHERYVARLLEGHVPLALRHHPTLRRYVVNIVEGTRGPAPPLDSIGELWFDTLADYRERLYDSPAGAGIIARDVAGFMGSTAAYVTTEHVHRTPAAPPDLGRRAPGGKLFACLERIPGAIASARSSCRALVCASPRAAATCAAPRAASARVERAPIVSARASARVKGRSASSGRPRPSITSPTAVSR